MEVKTENVQEQINQINQKLDLVLHYVNEQRLKSEMITDLLKDVSPIINEAGIDFTYKLHEFEQKGYFEFFKQMADLFDNAVVAYQKTDFDQNKKYSIWKIIREMNSPEIKRTLGFMITFLKNISKESITNK